MDMEPKKLADTISEVDACFFGAGVQRDAIPLCRVQGCSALLRSRGKAHWQVKGGSHYRVKDEVPWRVGYYLTQNFAGLAALPPSPARNIFAGRRKNV